MVYPGSARPIEPGTTFWPGVLPIWAVVSVWPYPSRTVIAQAVRTCSITSGLSGSPAATHSRIGTFQLPRSAWTSIRQTVGGAQNVSTPHRTIVSSSGSAANRAWLTTSTVAPAFQGAKTLLQACLAQPGEEMFRCTSPGRTPSQYIVDRCPTG